MKKSVSLLLIVILLISGSINFIPSGNCTELINSPEKIVSEIVSKARHSISSISSSNPNGISNSVLSVVRGTVTLLTPKRLGSLKSIYKGSDKVIKRRKIIKLKDSVNKVDSSLEIGEAGKKTGKNGYVFNFPDFTREIAELKKTGKIFSVRQLSVSYIGNEDSTAQAGFDLSNIRAIRTKKAVIIKGRLSKELEKGKAKGRFILKFTKK